MFMKRLLDRLSRSAFPAPVAARVHPLMEGVEERVLMAAGPKVKDIFADNRGQIVVSFDRPVKPGSIGNQSVEIYQIGKNGAKDKKAATVSFNKKKNQLTATAKVKANRVYEIRLVSNKIQGLDGSKLDGEFKGGNKLSGNGEEGGNYVVRTKKRGDVQARYTTDLGIINVNLFPEDTPITVRNFQHYANRGDWDGTFFHRTGLDGSAANNPFVIQGGGFNVVNNKVTEIPNKGPITNEPTLEKPRNVRGTIAMARTSEVNSATNQWFFNLKDNLFLDDQNSGFTVFGEVADNASLRVIDNIGQKGRVFNFQSVNPVLGEVPVEDPEKVAQNGLYAVDLITVRRVALRMNVVAPPRGSNARSTRADVAKADSAGGDAAKTDSAAVAPAAAFAQARLTEGAEGPSDGVWSDDEAAVL